MARSRSSAWYENTANLLALYAHGHARAGERATALRRIRALGFDEYDDAAPGVDRRFWLGEFYDALNRQAREDLNRQDAEMILDLIDYLIGNHDQPRRFDGLASFLRR